VYLGRVSIHGADVHVGSRVPRDAGVLEHRVRDRVADRNERPPVPRSDRLQRVFVPEHACNGNNGSLVLFADHVSLVHLCKHKDRV
jgi:hypothetical protein